MDYAAEVRKIKLKAAIAIEQTLDSRPVGSTVPVDSFTARLIDDARLFRGMMAIRYPEEFKEVRGSS